MNNDEPTCAYCNSELHAETTVEYRAKDYCSEVCALEHRDYWLEKKGDQARDDELDLLRLIAIQRGER